MEEMVSTEIQENIEYSIVKGVEELKANDIKPAFTTIRVGKDGGSIAYEKSLVKLASKFGVQINCRILPESASTVDIISAMASVGTKQGLLLFQPLPKHIDVSYLKKYISDKIDIDCFGYRSIGLFYGGMERFLPCTAESVHLILNRYLLNMSGKHAVILGRSDVIGRPLAKLLLDRDMTVTVCHSKTKNLPTITKQADVLISAIGKPHFIISNMIKKGAAVIDVGTTYVDGKLQGDVDFDDVSTKAEYLTPVKNGVGSLTSLLLINNAMRVQSSLLEDLA